MFIQIVRTILWYFSEGVTSIGIPAPLTVEIIMEIQVPRKITPPNTMGCSGSLKIQRIKNDLVVTGQLTT